jgi:hypothetical protein
MKLKIFIIIAVMLMAGVTAVTLLVRPRTPRFAPQQQWQEAISNYSKAFTLNTNPPLWPDIKGATNGSH